MIYLIIVVIGSIIGGPIGFIIGLAICGYLIYEQNKDQFDLESNSSKSTVKELTPCINILCHFALYYEPKWTSEKVKYIKDIFSNICITESDTLYLRNQLKERNDFILNQNISNWLNLNPSLEDRTIIFNAATILLLNTCSDLEKAKSDSLSFGAAIGLNSKYCNNFFSDHAYNENYHLKQDISVVEWASELLGVSMNASVEEIQKAYRLKIREFHPDRNVNVTSTVRDMLHEQTRLINEARDILLQKGNS